VTMDAIIRRTRRLSRSVALVATVSTVGLAPIAFAPGSASALTLAPACAAQPTTQSFARFGDNSNYFLMPAGSFESGTSGWNLGTGPSVVNGNESYFVNSADDSQSLALPGNSAVVSPTVCVAMGENTIRLFIKNSGVAGSVLHVKAFVQNPLTGLVLSTAFDVNGTAGNTDWAPSAQMLIPNLLGGVLGTQNLTLAFSTTGTNATWNIDDVYVDPFKSR
jgi:hypothetical protein